MSASFPVREASGTRDVALAREMFLEYASTLPISLCFQGFDEEVATLPGRYVPPSGRLFLAGPPGEAVGCVALRLLDPPPEALGGERAAPVGEVKRLYVRPVARGTGTGRRLVGAVVDAARTFGYRTLCLDTLDEMREARALYESFGFTTTGRYYGPESEGVHYYAMKLGAP